MAKRDKTIFRREHLEHEELLSMKAEASLIKADLESAYKRYKTLAARLHNYEPKHKSIVKDQLDLAEKYLQFGCSIHTFFGINDTERAIEKLAKAGTLMANVIIKIEKEDGTAE